MPKPPPRAGNVVVSTTVNGVEETVVLDGDEVGQANPELPVITPEDYREDRDYMDIYRFMTEDW